MEKLEQGTGQVTLDGQKVHLLRQTATRTQYSNAQIQDYSAEFLHTAPLRLSLTACFSHPIDQLKGTGGFGFWNAPFAPASYRLRFPKAAWYFFGSPPLNLPLAYGVSGQGFKAATIDATHWPFFALLPTAPFGFLLMRVPFWYRNLWPIGQRAIKVSEASLNQMDITRSHTYQLDWLPKSVVFSIDGQVIHRSPHSPTGKMGFVAWLDNQYALVTPQGRFGWGLVEAATPQWLEIQNLSITPLPASDFQP